MKLLLTIISIFSVARTIAGTYYVTDSGSSSNGGTNDITDSWELQYALDNAIGGDIVWIKAGEYNGYYVQNNDGTEGNLIKFIGYKNVPGDIISVNGSTFSYGDTLDNTKMPLIKEIRSTTNVGTGMGLRINGDFVHVENIQLQYYQDTFRTYGNNNVYINIIVADSGNFTTSTIYSGRAMGFTGNNLLVKNCYAQNSAAEGIMVVGSKKSKFYHIQYYADSTHINPTDYYFQLINGARDNYFEDITVGRMANLFHGGHGIGLKAITTAEPRPMTNNRFYGFRCINTYLEVQYDNAYGNYFYNGVLTNEYGGNYGGLNIRNGADHNYFSKIVLDGCGIKFDNNTEEVENGADDNYFNQIIVKNFDYGINFMFYDVSMSGDVDRNLFYNCTFYNLTNLFIDNRANSGTKFINCIIDNVDNEIGTIGSYVRYGVDVEYINTNFSNLGFTIPSGINITNLDPQFTNASNDDFSVGQNMKEIGIKTKFLNKKNDLGAIQDIVPKQQGKALNLKTIF